MKLVPKEGSLIYYDYEKLREDPDLAPIWNQFTSFPEPEGKLNYLARNNLYNIYYQSTDYKDWFYTYGGDFDLEKIRDDLQYRGWKRGTYRGVEVWHGEKGYTKALFRDKIIEGSVEQIETVIKVMKGEEESLYDDAGDIANKLSDGFIISIREMESDTIYGPRDAVMGWGASYEKISKEEVKRQQIIKFIDERKAKDFVTNLYGYEKVTVQGKYAIWTYIVKIDEWKYGER